MRAVDLTPYAPGALIALPLQAGLTALDGISLLVGMGLAVLLPKLLVHVAWEYVVMAAALAVVIGLAAGVTPAARASRTPPVEALRSE